MTIDRKLYDTNTLLGVMKELPVVPSYWLDLCFGNQVNFETEEIDFEKIPSVRRIAPFVAPTAQGRPIYSEGSNVTRFKPAYVKPKDAVTPNRMLKRRPGELFSAAPQSPNSRFNATVVDILAAHKNAMAIRDEWLAAQAVINGQVTIADEGYPERVVQFGRDAGHTVVKTAGNYWTTSSDILGDIETWRTTMRKAKFGGAANRLTVGPDVWAVMRKNADILKQLDITVRGTTANINTGLREGLDVEYVGNLGGNLDVYVYSDYFQAADGIVSPFMSSKDIVLTGPNVQGYRCYGAILDQAAQLRATQIFSKMWDENDPPVTFVMSQSAPLMVPVNPNATFKATVLA